MYEELIAFLGLIVLELKHYLKQQTQVGDDYSHYELRTEINTIIDRIYKIQKDLTDASSYEIYNHNYIQLWENEYKLSSSQLSENLIQHPVGYCFVAKAICKRLKPSLIINHLSSFLETLGYYINYFYDS